MTDEKGHITAYYNELTHELSNLRWDDNGNLAQQTLYSVNNNVPTYQTMRMLFWDEDDRLNLVAGDGYLSYYAYGHDGNRAIKMTGTATIDPNGTLINTGDLNNITIYPNEYLTVTQAEYTKYYYAGGNRIASKIGTGGFEKMQQLCTLEQSLTANANILFDNVLQHTVNTTSQPTDEYPVEVCNGYNVSNELLHSQLLDFYISNTVLNFTQNNLLQQFRQNLAGGTEPVYYFHSDHLGSASWITNNTGLPVQHLLYLPFGEHFANEHSSGYDERFTFTGKERDAETGYYYHGARFNSSDIGWLSVDPMAEKYPSLTPYNYCAWNPVKLVDADGKDIYRLDVSNGSLKLYHKTKDKTDKIIAGSYQGIGRAKTFKETGRSIVFSKGVLDGKKDKDYSKTGFTSSNGTQEQATNVAKFISFNCYKELAGAGFTTENGSSELEVFSWSKNTYKRAKNPPKYSAPNNGNIEFHFHIHCGKSDGTMGRGVPSGADLNFARDYASIYGEDNFYIISRHDGVTQYNQFGVIPSNLREHHIPQALKKHKRK